MNWLKNLVRPKLRELVGGQKEIPDNLWHNCPNCEEMIFHRDLEKDLWVCRYCGHHMRMEAGNRLEMLFDNGAYQKVELGDVPTDPLKFRDRRKYTERMKEAQNRTGETDALIVAHGKMGGFNVVIAALDFSFMGGSMGSAVGEGITRQFERSVEKRQPAIVISSSGGARMQEGVLSLMQMAKTCSALARLRGSR